MYALVLVWTLAQWLAPPIQFGACGPVPYYQAGSYYTRDASGNVVTSLSIQGDHVINVFDPPVSIDGFRGNGCAAASIEVVSLETDTTAIAWGNMQVVLTNTATGTDGSIGWYYRTSGGIVTELIGREALAHCNNGCAGFPIFRKHGAGHRHFTIIDGPTEADFRAQHYKALALNY